MDLCGGGREEVAQNRPKSAVILLVAVSSIIARIKLAERSFASGQIRCIGLWCDAKLDDQSKSSMYPFYETKVYIVSGRFLKRQLNK